MAAHGRPATANLSGWPGEGRHRRRRWCTLQRASRQAKRDARCTLRVGSTSRVPITPPRDPPSDEGRHRRCRSPTPPVCSRPAMQVSTSVHSQPVCLRPAVPLDSRAAQNFTALHVACIQGHGETVNAPLHPVDLPTQPTWPQLSLSLTRARPCGRDREGCNSYSGYIGYIGYIGYSVTPCGRDREGMRSAPLAVLQGDYHGSGVMR